MLQIIVVTRGQVVLDRMSIPKLPLYGLRLANRNNLASAQLKYSEWPLGSAKSPSGGAESGVVPGELGSAGECWAVLGSEAGGAVRTIICNDTQSLSPADVIFI